MTTGIQEPSKDNFGNKFLRWINLRPGEGERTFLMFASYAATSIGVLWLEATASAMFLEHFSADNLPVIYLASTLISIFLGSIYGWLQSFVAMRWLIVLVALLMAAPLPLFVMGFKAPEGIAIAGFTVFRVSVLLMRLWQQVLYVLSDLNTTITVNQLFNIREIKRAYPLISSGVLVADVLSGFALPLVLSRLGLSGVIWVAFGMILTGAGLLFSISQRQQRYFRSSVRRESSNTEATKQLRGQSMNYRWLLLAFFVLAEAMFLLVDFQFSKQLESLTANPLEWFGAVGPNVTRSERIAGFLGLFQGVLGILELIMQWGLSPRILETLGIFATSGLLPILVLAFGSTIALFPYLPQFGELTVIIFWMIVVLKFFYELIHFTLLASVSPVLFQPIPARWSNAIQASVRGSAEPIATGLTGGLLLASVGLGWQKSLGADNWRSLLFGGMILLAAAWLINIWLIQRDYVKILVLSARQDQLGMSSNPATIKELKRAAIEALSKPGLEDSRLACIELLLQIDPRNATEILAPMLLSFPPEAQCRVLEFMVDHASPEHIVSARRLINFSAPPEVVAAALRYVFLTDPHADLKELSIFIRPQSPPAIRGTAAALMVELGNPQQKAEATNVLRLMLTHAQEQERSEGCHAIRHLKYLQALQIYVSEIVKKETSISVRRSVLEAISMTHYEKGYPALVDGLYDPETRHVAMQALTYLENESLPKLQLLVTDWRQPESVRSSAWMVIGQISTTEALDFMVDRLTTSWGEDRAHILRSLIKVPKDEGIEVTAEKLGRSGIEMLIEQELMLIGQTSAAILDLSGQITHRSCEEMLRRALRTIQLDCVDRLFMLMQFLYEPDAIQAAAFNLKSGSSDNVAQGLEILDNKLDIPQKRAFLTILERIPRAQSGRSTPGMKLRRTSHRLSRQEQLELQEQLQSLSSLITYQPMEPSDRLIHLMDLRHFLSDWVLACGFHLARAEQWSLERHHVLGGLRSSSGFLREAVLAYLQSMYPAAYMNVLPRMKNDPEPILRFHIRDQLQQLGPQSSSPLASGSDDDDMPNTAILGPM